MYHTVLVTATEWDNFFALRAHPDAEIHIAKLAEEMLTAYNESTPKQLKPGEWHIPFGDKGTNLDLLDEVAPFDGDSDVEHLAYGEHVEQLRVKIAIARCARLSYETLGDDPKIDYAADLRLFDQLLTAGHMSPFEHVARAMNQDEFNSWRCGLHTTEKKNNSGMFACIDYYEIDDDYEQAGWCGNFRGFIQYRKTLSGENKLDNRVTKK